MAVKRESQRKDIPLICGNTLRDNMLMRISKTQLIKILSFFYVAFQEIGDCAVLNLTSQAEINLILIMVEFACFFWDPLLTLDSSVPPYLPSPSLLLFSFFHSISYIDLKFTVRRIQSSVILCFMVFTGLPFGAWIAEIILVWLVGLEVAGSVLAFHADKLLAIVSHWGVVPLQSGHSHIYSATHSSNQVHVEILKKKKKN